eukprot:1717710-Prymnesium_polylepis.1
MLGSFVNAAFSDCAASLDALRLRRPSCTLPEANTGNEARRGGRGARAHPGPEKAGEHGAARHLCADERLLGHERHGGAHRVHAQRCPRRRRGREAHRGLQQRQHGDGVRKLPGEVNRGVLAIGDRALLCAWPVGSETPCGRWPMLSPEA